MKYLRTGGGYFNVGCSELVAERRIALVQWRNAGRAGEVAPVAGEIGDANIRLAPPW